MRKIAKRNNIHDLAFFAFPRGPVELDQAKIAAHGVEYAPMALVLEASRYPVTGAKMVRGSAEEAELFGKGRLRLGDQ